MLDEALDLLGHAERLQRQFFQIGQALDGPRWEPPVDMVVNGSRLELLVALPGVTPERFEVRIERQVVIVRGERSFGAGIGPGAIVRLEIPYGRFERRIALPDGDYQVLSAQLENGCLRLGLEQVP